MRHGRMVGLLAAFLASTALAKTPAATRQSSPAPAARPSHSTSPVPIGSASAAPAEPGVLFNGWKLSPAGQNAQVSDMPLKIVVAPDGETILAVCSGKTTGVAVVSAKSRQTTQFVPLKTCFNGLAFAPDHKTFYVTGGDSDSLYVFTLENGKITLNQTVALAGHMKTVSRKKMVRRGAANPVFLSGIAVDQTTGRLYICNESDGHVWVVNPKDYSIDHQIDAGDYPYTCVLTADGRRLYVSNWGDRSVSAINLASDQQQHRIPVGVRPNEMTIAPDGRLFVACAGDNTVSVIPTRGREPKDEVISEKAPPAANAMEIIATSLYPNAPEGSTPDGVAISADGKALFVANADNNDVMVVDISDPKVSKVVGFVPSGWYPTAVACAGKTLLVASGKGLGNFGPNTPPPNNIVARSVAGVKFEHPTGMLKGYISFIDTPTGAELAAYTKQVRENCPYMPSELRTATKPPAASAIPTRVGDPCPIKYVLYIIKENRTYDQMFGDMTDAQGKHIGNGDPRICMFGENVCPNHHELARDYVLMDNLYCNSEVSEDGHSWCDGAIATDYRQRDWVLSYTGHGSIPADKDMREPANGFLWDACRRAGVSFMCYGEGASSVATSNRGTWSGGRDMNRVKGWISDLQTAEKTGDLPQFMIMSLGEDHTKGTRPGAFTPQAAVGSNDIGIGKIVEAASHSRFWPRMAIFIIEDDAQNGPDHVDSHRTAGLVISPYVKRHFVDSTPYTTASMVRTMELILGIPPMTQYDAAATPMYNAFMSEPIVTPYTLVPAKINLAAINKPTAPGAQACAKMNFDEYDEAPEEELNEILWLDVKGPNAPYPTPIHRAIFTK